MTTANNHCLDRGIHGLGKTIEALDRYNIKHVGTYNKENRGFIESINGMKIGFFILYLWNQCLF